MFVYVCTLLIIFRVQNKLKNIQTLLMSTSITPPHTRRQNVDKMMREKEGKQRLMERKRLAVGGFLKDGWVLSLHDKTVWGEGDTTRSHCHTSANRSAPSGRLTGFLVGEMSYRSLCLEDCRHPLARCPQYFVSWGFLNDQRNLIKAEKFTR